MTNRSESLSWLGQVAKVAASLPQEPQQSPYYSQRNLIPDGNSTSRLPQIVTRVRALIEDFQASHYFIKTLGYSCVNEFDEVRSSPELELDRRVCKPHLLSQEPELWTELDLCDYVEVFHDLASWPTIGWYHGDYDCGWHPEGYSDRIGRTLYRWRMNSLLQQAEFKFRLADRGEDTGRMVRSVPRELGKLIDDALDSETGSRDDLDHAIALFRSRNSTRETQRSAVRSLAGILEERRQVLKERLLKKDEHALFQIANQFDLRHRNADQHSDYQAEFLEWIFYWYLATVKLTDILIADESRRTRASDGTDHHE